MAASIGGFVLGTVVQEFARGARARHRQYGEPTPYAIVQLLSRNRRRYGGYIVHIAIVLLFVGFAGMAFKTETEATLRPGESAELKGRNGPFTRSRTWASRNTTRSIDRSPRRSSMCAATARTSVAFAPKNA